MSAALCSNCGATLHEGASFCAACGHSVALGIAPGPKAKKGWSVGRMLVIAFVIVPLFVVAAVTVALMVWSSQNHPMCACSLPAAVEMTDGYNNMVASDNAAKAQRDNPDVTTSSAGLQARVVAHENFDAQVAALAFPSAAGQRDQQKVLDADKALEQVITQEALVRGNTKDYNAVLATEQPLQDAFAAAVKQLGND
jgi:uncharacterized membrane protein